MNPCPCRYFNDPQKACTCASAVVTKYQKRKTFQHHCRSGR
ncbi:MAG: ATP-binding protein [Anaerolineales bacterium]|nr:ATP-binding protein [Anaerolineales bacterium]